MKKNYFYGFYKSFGFLSTIILPLCYCFIALAACYSQRLAFVKTDATIVAHTLSAALVALFGGIAVLGLSDLKNKKFGFIDFLVGSAMLGSIGSLIIAATKKNGSKSFLISLGICVGLLLVAFIVRAILVKFDGTKRGSKVYFKALANKLNPILALVVSALLAIVICSMRSNLDHIIKFYGLGVCIGAVVVSILISTCVKKNDATLFDALLLIAFLTFAIVTVYFFNALGKYQYGSIRGCAYITCALLIGLLYRSESIVEEDDKLSKYKFNAYFADLYSKHDVWYSISAGLVVAGGLFAVNACKNTVKSYLKLMHITVKLPSIQIANYILIGGFAVLLILGLIVIAGIKKPKIKFVDVIVNVLLHISIFLIPFVVYLFTKLQTLNLLDNIALLVLLILVLVLIVFTFILQAIRIVNYEIIEEPAVVEETEVDEANNEEDSLNNENEETSEESQEETSEEPQEEAVEESQEETPEEVSENLEEQEENTCELSEDDEFLSAVESIPEATTSSVTEVKQEPEQAEEVVYVDENGNEISNDEVSEEDADGEDELDIEDDEAEEDDEELEPVEEDINAKERAIINPEVTVVDENGKPKRIKMNFNARMMFAPYQAKEYYNEIKNYLIMYRAKGRFSARCESFRYHGLVAKVALAGKSVKVCLAIDPTSLEGTKYHYKDVSNKKQYVEVPTMIKVRSDRGLKYFKELVDLMMAAREVKPKKNFKPVNYMPTLIPNGQAILGTIGLSTDYLYDTMNVRSIPSEMPNNLADYLPVIQGEDLGEDEVEAVVYLDTLCNHFLDYDEITIDILKSMHIVNKGNVLRIKARGTLDRKLIIYAEYFDEDALKMLMCTNCTAIKIIR